MTANPAPDKNPSPLEPPGGILIWLIVLLEIITFGVGFLTFMIQRRAEPDVFHAGRAALQQPLAFANTLVLLTGGWCMANALARLRQGSLPAARRWITPAILTGLLFLTLKGTEYADKLSHGLTLRHDTFFTLYWLLTGFHFLHVAVGVVILTVLRHSLTSPTLTAEQEQNVEAGGIFWHLCDLLWLFLYPLLYLLP